MMSQANDGDNSKPDDLERLRKAEARKSKAEKMAVRSTQRLLKLLAAQRLATDPAHADLIAKDRELRGELHQVRLRSAKKLMRLTNILNESFRISEDLLTLHTSEVAILDEIQELRENIHSSEIQAHQHAVMALPRMETRTP